MSQAPIGKVDVLAGDLAGQKGDLCILAAGKDARSLPPDTAAALGPLGDAAGGLLSSGDFRGDLGETVVLYGSGKVAPRLLVVGLGGLNELSRERLRSAAASAARKARDLGVGRALFLLPLPASGDGKGAFSLSESAGLITEGALIGSYRFTEYKTVGLEKYRALGELVLLLPADSDAGEAERACARARARAAGVNWARDLASTPANLLTPTALADAAEQMAGEEGLTFRRMDRDECARLGMNAFLSVAQGSRQPPWFLTLEYAGAGGGSPTYALVGKGLTFDAGGISLKPPLNMHEMKYDMCGAAAVLGVMKCLRSLKVPQRVVAAVPATENLPGGGATKPGDLVRSFSGKTIEILNTDAEGRLALADALSYVIRTYKPAAVVDLATLTGAVLHALGHYGAAVLSNDDELNRQIEAASRESGERTWRLPLWEEFPDHLKGEVADLKNIGDANAGAGTIAGGVFLKEFVGETPWAHIDIAGSAWWDKDRPLLPKGPSGFGVRLVCDWLGALGGSA